MEENFTSCASNLIHFNSVGGDIDHPETETNFDCSSGQFGAATHTFRDVQLRKPRQLSSFFLEMRDGVNFACGSPHFSPAYIAGPAQHFFACFCSALGRRMCHIRKPPGATV
jgi:hypothetical protein